MSRVTRWMCLAGAAWVVATILATQYVLGLLPTEKEAGSAAAEVGFLAYLLLPLSVALLFIVAITVLVAAYRIARAFQGAERDPD